jgi:hypothetical protein
MTHYQQYQTNRYRNEITTLVNKGFNPESIEVFMASLIKKVRFFAEYMNGDAATQHEKFCDELLFVMVPEFLNEALNKR